MTLNTDLTSLFFICLTVYLTLLCVLTTYLIFVNTLYPVSTKSEVRRKEPDVVITRLPRPATTYHTPNVQYNAKQHLHVPEQRATSPEVYTYPSSPQSSSPSLSTSYIYHAKSHKSTSSVASSKGIIGQL